MSVYYHYFTLHLTLEYGGDPFQFTYTEGHEKQAAELVQACQLKVANCLKTHKKLLLIIAKYLSNNSRLDKDKLKVMANDYFKKNKMKPFKFIESNEYYDFRKKVMAM